MDFRELSQQAQLSAQHLQAIQRRGLQGAIEEFLASRSYDSPTLSSTIVTTLIDRGDIAGHSWSGDTLRRFDIALAEGIAKLEAALPAVSPLEVDDRDPLAPRAFA